jgi:MarR family transcriptional regulator, temperature-dependent positive regulator of motility
MTTLADAAKRPESASSRESSRAGEFRLSESPSHLLRRAEQYAAEIFLRSGTDGVTLRQTVLLAAIAESEGASQSDLVTTTGIDRSTLAEMMARMETKGLIARTAAADDGRAKSVKLTRDGRNRMEAALPAMRTVDDALLKALARNRRAAFTAALAALAGAADEAHRESVADLRQARRAAKVKKRTAKAKTAKRGRKTPGARKKK